MSNADNAAAAELARTILALGPDHGAVIASIVQSIVARSSTALSQYGALNLAADKRDLVVEQNAELLDALFYAHAEIVRLRRLLP